MIKAKTQFIDKDMMLSIGVKTEYVVSSCKSDLLRKLLHLWVSSRQTVCHRGLNPPWFPSWGGGIGQTVTRDPHPQSFCLPIKEATDSADGHMVQSAEFIPDKIETVNVL